MLNVGSLKEGFVLDHIKAGKSMEIYKYLGLDKLDCQVAIIKNAKSGKMGRKDIIKIDNIDRTFDFYYVFASHLVALCVFDNCNLAVKLVETKILIYFH